MDDDLWTVFTEAEYQRERREFHRQLMRSPALLANSHRTIAGSRCNGRCSEYFCPSCKKDHSLTAVKGLFSVSIVCWRCDYRRSLERNPVFIGEALSLHADLMALEGYRKDLIEFIDYKEQLRGR